MNTIPNPLSVPCVLDALGFLLTIPPFLERFWAWQAVMVPGLLDRVLVILLVGWVVSRFSTRKSYGQ
jgi:hypothetical protein